jgi:DNA gyrase subunit A
MLALKSQFVLKRLKKLDQWDRNTSGVKRINSTAIKTEVIGMVTIENPMEESVLVVSENGYGKKFH